METFAIIAAERRRLAGLLDTLSADQWATPSLCAGWTVRHVVAHLVTPFLVSTPALLGAVLRRRGLAGAMDHTARRLAGRPTTDLVETLRRNADHRFTPPGGPPEAPLTDILVHGMDIRWPLGRPGDRPDPATLLPVLDFLAGPKAGGLVPRGRLAGLRLVATDVDWAHGDGAVVEGPALPLAMAALGRRVALPELTGPGAARL